MCERTGEIKCYCEKGERASSSMGIVSLHALFRKLFTDHHIYLSSFAKASIFQSPDELYLKQRVLDNAKDIGDNLGRLPKIGQSNGDIITSLFTRHVQLGERCVIAAKNHNMGPTPENKTQLDVEIKSALQQGDQIAQVFNTLAPCLSLQGLIKDFRIHNQQEIDLTNILIKRKFSEEVMALDHSYNHLLGIADNLYFAFEK